MSLHDACVPPIQPHHHILTGHTMLGSHHICPNRMHDCRTPCLTGLRPCCLTRQQKQARPRRAAAARAAQQQQQPASATTWTGTATLQTQRQRLHLQQQGRCSTS
jgi:hypothetical protein